MGSSPFRAGGGGASSCLALIPQAPVLRGGGETGMAKHACGRGVETIPDAAHTRVTPCSPGDRRPVGLSCANRGAKMLRLAAAAANSTTTCAEAACGRGASTRTPASMVIRRRIMVRGLLARLRIAQDLDQIRGLRVGRGVEDQLLRTVHDHDLARYRAVIMNLQPIVTGVYHQPAVDHFAIRRDNCIDN